MKKLLVFFLTTVTCVIVVVGLHANGAGNGTEDRQAELQSVLAIKANAQMRARAFAKTPGDFDDALQFQADCELLSLFEGEDIKKFFVEHVDIAVRLPIRRIEIFSGRPCANALAAMGGSAIWLVIDAVISEQDDAKRLLLLEIAEYTCKRSRGLCEDVRVIARQRLLDSKDPAHRKRIQDLIKSLGEWSKEAE